MVEVTSDHHAFLDLALPHLDVVWSLARRVSVYPLEPEDLVQETYTRAFASFGRFRGGDVRSWLVSICLNTARSHLRRTKRRPREVHDADVEMPAPDDVGAEAMGSLQRDALVAALDEIPEPQRVAILLMDVSGLTARQAAEVVGCPRGTILARVHRGRRKLAQLLRERNAIDGL
jgi:RNA polymerase sigma-70 factor (ECF subfamily)